MITIHCTAELFGHQIAAPILFAPIGINKLYTPLGELVPAKIAGELGLPVCIILYPSYDFLEISILTEDGILYSTAYLRQRRTQSKT
jgi:isopentenyl diphosphate isomerase/L-lactate dehydrogenase-like FMN-dependent dehydrogenase